MLDLDIDTIKKLGSLKTKNGDKLYLIARFIEEKYQYAIQPNYWEDKFEPLEKNEKIFYKIWLWLSYIEWESLVKPIVEFESVYGKERKKELISYIETEEEYIEELESYYSVDGSAGERLLNWAKKELITTNNK
ncbi:MAG: hypothetical protein JEZ14_13115 [Marinilabiliaceae bacterium]|nr:hypothetical protein [Marinilabiliaceae bacterium]